MMTYDDCVALAAEGGVHGSIVEGCELECYSRAYMAERLRATVASLAKHARKGRYEPEAAWRAWGYVADSASLAYNGTGDPLDPRTFRPASKHDIDKDGRRMAALYMERRWRAEVYRLAGATMPPDQIADCDPLEGEDAQ